MGRIDTVHDGEQGVFSEYGHRYAVLFIVLFAVLMAVIDSTVVNIALPSMTRFFSAELSDTQWTITAYLITMTSLLLVFGHVSGYVGRARLFLTGIVIFTVSSLACGLSVNLAELIFFRILQGAGAAMLFSISSALIFASTPLAEQGRAMGYLGSTVAIGGIAGPVLGGFIVDSLGWEYIFFINIPIGLLLIIAALKYLRFDVRHREQLEMDWYGSAAMVGVFVSMIFVLGSLAADTTITPVVVIESGVFILLLSVFIWYEKRCPAPLLDLSIFSHRAFLLPVIGLVIAFAANFMMAVVGPFYFEGVLGYRPSQVGLVFLINPAVMMIVAPIAGTLYDRYPKRNFASLGMLISTVAFAMLAYCTITVYIFGMLVAFVLFGIGVGLFQSPNNTIIMSALPKEKLAVASSVAATARNLGMTLGVSFGSILLSLQLVIAGSPGDVLGADPTLLARSISHIMMISAVLCLVVAVLALKR
ncbi:MAG TPA: MFS transporter [Methanoregula sp.]|nr:MFS transporter [Methanoregula sp.]